MYSENWTTAFSGTSHASPQGEKLSTSQDTCLTVTYHFQVRDILELLDMLQTIHHFNLCYSCF